MKYQPGWALAQDAMEQTIKNKKFQASSFSTKQLEIIQKVFSDYLMYIWLIMGDTRCNVEGYTNASILITEYFEGKKEKIHAT